MDLHVPSHPVRVVTATSLFDGHDAAINIMRRILQGMGCEVVHLGHNRSVDEVVTAALQEDAQGIAISSYQGGHVEYFKYMVDLLKARGGAHIQVFGGGGGVIVPSEIKELQSYGVTRIYTPEDGPRMGLAGMIGEMVMRCDHDLSVHVPQALSAIQGQTEAHWRALAQLITTLENGKVGAELKAAMLAEAMDLVWACGLDPKLAAARLMCSTSQLLKLIKDYPAAMARLNPARLGAGQHALR